jgi:hypothetical protein
MRRKQSPIKVQMLTTKKIRENQSNQRHLRAPMPKNRCGSKQS